MKSQKIFVAAALVICLSGSGAARAADVKTQSLINAYNAKNYETAEQLGEKLVAKRPSDFTARYYLANTYVILHKNEQAISQYRICINNGTDGTLRQYSSTALERLLKQKETALVGAAKNEKSDKEQLKVFQAKLRAESQKEQDRIRHEWNDALSQLNRNSPNRYGFYRHFGYGFGRNRYYDDMYRINDYYSRRLRDLTDYEESMISQANCGKGRIRLMPSLSSSKVKNYINYADDSEAEYIPVDNPLEAKAQSLADVAPKIGKSQSTKKAAGKAHFQPTKAARKP